jgi:hypothetical protein
VTSIISCESGPNRWPSRSFDEKLTHRRSGASPFPSFSAVIAFFASAASSSFP